MSFEAKLSNLLLAQWVQRSTPSSALIRAIGPT
jgi:hypothetical protein